MSLMKALQMPHDIRLSVDRTGIVFVSSASLLVLALSLWSKITLRKRKLRQDVNKLAGMRKLADLPKGFEDLDEEAEYDYIVVGGGTAGCAMASRLSEDPNIRVLLLEAGPSSLDEPLVNIPPGAVELFRDKRVSFDLYTTEQKHADGRKRFWPRGKMLGGCSAINAMMFHGGAPSDYDEWVRQGGPGAEQWSFKNLFPYFLKFESFVPHPEFAGVDTSVRGSSGPVKIGYFGHFSAISRRFLSACGNAGIPLVPDVNTPNGPWLGATKIMTFIDKSGRRVTTESSYLTNDVLKRKNLTVAIRVGVTRVLFSNGNLTKKEGSLGLGASEPEPRAVGVEFAKEDKKEERFVVRASKEVILCAGAVHTPHILLLSGIGPSNELAQFSPEIPLVCDLDGVGKHLQDHLVVHLRYRVGKEAGSLNWIGGDKSNRQSVYPGNGKAVANGLANGNGHTNGYANGHTNGHANGNGTAKTSVVATKQKSTGPSSLDKAVMKLRFAGAMVRWLFGFRGALTCNVCEAVAFVRSTDVFPAISPSSVSSSIEALANHPGAPDLELMSSPLAWTEHGAGPIPSGDLVSFSVVHLRPTSMGEVKLRSADAWDEPEIDPNYLSTQNDVDTLARGVAILLKITRTEPLATILDNGNSDPNLKPTPNDPLLPTDSNSLEHLLDHSLHLQPTTVLQNFIKARAETLYHPTSTARMAPRSEGGVVDTSLRVYGVKGLRIVDASVFPTIVSGHTVSPVLAVAEKAAEMVKQSFYDDN